MIKLILLSILICFYCIVLKAQTFEGKVVEKTSKLPIPYATIKLLNSREKTFANNDGIFNVQATEKPDSLLISALGYLSLKVSIPAKGKNLIVFELAESVITLSDVTIAPIRTINILTDAIKKSMAAYTAPIVLNGYYREYVKRDSFLTKYADGVVAYHIEKKKNGEAKVALHVEDSRVKELKVTEEENKLNALNSPINIKDIGVYANPTIFKLMDTNNLQFYKFKLLEIDDDKIYIIYFEPIRASKNAMYYGKIYIDKEKSLILGVDYDSAPISKEFLPSITLFGLTVSSIGHGASSRYKVDANGYYLSYISRNFGLKVKSKNSWNQLNRFKSEFFVIEIQTKNLDKFDDNYNKQSLYKRGNNYQTEFWKNQNIVTNTREETEFLLKEN